MFELRINKYNTVSMASKLMYVYKYFINLKVAYHVLGSLWGFIVFVAIFSQCISGTMLAFSVTNDCMLIAYSREEEDGENNYTDDFF
ncbi:MAG: hypothetical protein KDH96_07785 [Candidatus Riesia sp.]|nr:hypothetical protein [Candidatus Riesia sp.]